MNNQNNAPLTTKEIMPLLDSEAQVSMQKFLDMYESDPEFALEIQHMFLTTLGLEAIHVEEQLVFIRTQNDDSDPTSWMRPTSVDQP